MEFKFSVYFLLILFVMVNLSGAQDTASDILKNASKKAKLENKNVFVMFNASWCGWCKKMDKGMNNEACKSFFDTNYVIEHLTVKESSNNKHLENPGAEDLLIKYKGGNSGIPFWLIFNSDGELLADSFDEKGQNLGCPSSEEEVAIFIKKLEMTSSLKPDELNIISKIFTK
ncbi:MAG: thioredoxin family protein [Flaviramulus sp.]|nr:thioredoxin family protein [Flaviramulus sp.]